MDINLIAAIGKNNELGKNNDLIWKLKGDMKFFRETTMGHPIVMGRKTFESLPKVLPGRKNIVISTNEIKNEEIEVYKNIKDFLLKYQEYGDDIFVIGGASIYKQFIDLATNMYLTEIDGEEKSADVYFPSFDKKEWEKEILLSNQENSINFKHVLYKIKK